MGPKRTGFAALGWLVWKLLAIIGVPYAKNKIRGSTTTPTAGHSHAPGLPAPT